MTQAQGKSSETIPSLIGVEQKIKRAHNHINRVSNLTDLYTRKKPYAARVDKELHDGGIIGRCIAVKNSAIGPPSLSIVLIAGEALYQLRSALDHLICQLVILNGHAAKLDTSRRHQFPIFESRTAYSARAGAMIDGVSEAAASLIDAEQPFARIPTNLRNDMLWILQDLNNTDKHRLLPVTVVGIDVVRACGEERTLFTVQSPDIVLQDGKVFFSFIWPNPEQEIRAELSCALAFKQFMSPYGVTLGIDGILAGIASRVGHLVDKFRWMFPESRGRQ